MDKRSFIFIGLMTILLMSSRSIAYQTFSGSKKIGNFVPGTSIPIIEEKINELNKFNYLIIFSWHIKKEIIRNLKRKGFKGKFILPLPIPKIVSN